eukprot:21217-Chlamydomonas_euryale.AAC.2
MRPHIRPHVHAPRPHSAAPPQPPGQPAQQLHHAQHEEQVGRERLNGGALQRRVRVERVHPPTRVKHAKRKLLRARVWRDSVGRLQQLGSRGAQRAPWTASIMQNASSCAQGCGGKRRAAGASLSSETRTHPALTKPTSSTIIAPLHTHGNAPHPRQRSRTELHT